MQFSITDETTGKEIREWLRDCPKAEVIGFVTYLNIHSDYEVPAYGNKDQIVSGLKGIDLSILKELTVEFFGFDTGCDDDDTDDNDDEHERCEEDEESDEDDSDEDSDDGEDE